jgi:DNA ligase-1
MKAFAELYANLDATTSSNAKLAALQAYFRQAPPEDAAWAVYFLSGGRPRQLVPTRLLRDMATQAANIEPWLFEESYQSVGDLAETISLLLPESTYTSEDGLAVWLEDKLLPLRGLAPLELAERLPALWVQLDQPSLMVCIKLITGSFRVGVSKLLVTRALAAMAGLHRPVQSPYGRRLSQADCRRIIRRACATRRAAVSVFSRPWPGATSGAV